MAQFVDNLLITLSLNAGKFKAGVKDVVTELRGLDKNIKQSGDKMKLFGSTVANAFAAGAIARGIKSTIDANAQLINQIATAEQVFGDGFEAIDKFSDAAVESVGLSKRAAIEAATFLGGLGKAAGVAEADLASFSTDLVKLAADLSAAFNTSVADAVQAIQSGFSGSSVEPLRRYNIVLSDTILKEEFFAITGQKVTGVLTTQQRMVAFLSALYKKSADYQGQWNRESDQALAAQQKLAAEFENLKATIGESLVPMFTEIVHGLQGITGAFNKLPHDVQTFASTLGVAALAAVAANKAITGLENALLGFGVSAKSVGRIGTTLRTGFLLLDAAMLGYSISAAQAANNTKVVEEAFSDLAKINPQNVADLFGIFAADKRVLDESKTSADIFEEVAQRNIGQASAILEAFKANPAALAAFNAFVGGASLTVEDMTRILRESAKTFAFQQNAAAGATAMITQYTGATDDATAATEDHNDAMDGAIDALQNWGDELTEHFIQSMKAYRESVKQTGDATRIALGDFNTDKVQAMADAFDEFLAARREGGGLTILDRLADVGGTFDDLIRIVKRNGGEIPDIFDLSSKRAANFRDAIQEAAAVVDEELSAVFAESGDDFGAITGRIDELRTQLREGLGEVTGLHVDVPAEKAKLDALIDQILPTDKEVKIGLDLSQRAKNELLAKIAVEMTKGVLPKVGTQLEIDLATGKKSPREVIKNAQLIADQNKLHIDFQLDPVRGDKIKVDKALQIFATKERDAIKLGVEIEDLPKVGRKILNVIAFGPDGKSGWPKVPMTTETTQSAEDVTAMLDPIVPDRIDVPVHLVPADSLDTIFGLPGAPPPIGGGGLRAGGTRGALGFSGLSVPVATAAAVAPIYVQTTINANVLGSPYDIARTVDKAMRRNARVMPTRP